MTRAHRRRTPSWLQPWTSAVGRRILIGIGVVVLAASIVVGELHTQLAKQQTTTAQASASSAQAKATATEQTAKAIADPLAALCASDPTVRARVGAACNTAAQVVAQPGPSGPAGRGVVGTAIDANGHLIVSYSDGTQVDVGIVVGHNGTAGVAGVSVTGSNIVNGHLVLTFSDGTNRDVGQVVGATGATGATGSTGAAGRGVDSTSIVNDRLMVAYTDGTSQDVGPLPTGPAGKDAPVVSSQTFNRPDGSVYSCSRSGGTDTAPVFTCAQTQPPTGLLTAGG